METDQNLESKNKHRLACVKYLKLALGIPLCAVCDISQELHKIPWAPDQLSKVPVWLSEVLPPLIRHKLHVQKDILATHLQHYCKRKWANTFSVFQVFPIQGISSFSQNLKICKDKHVYVEEADKSLTYQPSSTPKPAAEAWKHKLIIQPFSSQIFDTKALQAWNFPISSSPYSSLKGRGNPHAQSEPPLCRGGTLL